MGRDRGRKAEPIEPIQLSEPANEVDSNQEARRLSRRSLSKAIDAAFHYATLGFGLLIVVLIVWIGLGLYRQSELTRHIFGWHFLSTSVWDVPREVYGAAPFIYGTVVSTLVALALAVPIGVGAALFLTDIAPRRVAAPIAFLIELLAAVPSVIFGLWGFLVLCPWLQAHVNTWLVSHFGNMPLFEGPSYLTSMLAAGVILAIMVLPIITSVSRQVLLIVPVPLREGALALGATRWEVARTVVLPCGASGIAGAVMLALGRAVGETMAVVMVVGNNPQIQASLLKPGYTMPALLANQFNEAYTDEVQRSALLEIAFVLFVITLAVNAAARVILLMSSRAASGQSSGAAFRAVTTLSRWAGIALVALAVGFQVTLDLRRNGPRGMMGPVELVLLAAVGVSWIATIARQSHFARQWRRLTNKFMTAVIAVCAAVGCFVLGAVLAYITIHGLKALSVNFFTQLPKPPDDPAGGMKNAILGTGVLVGMASCIGIPIGILAGIFLSEFGGTRTGSLIRFAADVLNGIPSVVIGMFAYAAFVLPVQHFSAAAGGAALGIMMIPTIARTTEEILRMLPGSYREASVALGASRVQTIFRILLPAAKGGIVTGILLAIARISGETAPLIFTAFGNDEVATRLSQPVSSITMMIYRYATSAYPAWLDLAWSGALVLVVIVVIVNLLARFALRGIPAQ